jgi:hypothetical protein
LHLLIYLLEYMKTHGPGNIKKAFSLCLCPVCVGFELCIRKQSSCSLTLCNAIIFFSEQRPISVFRGKVIWSAFAIEKSFSYIGVLNCHLVRNMITTKLEAVDEDTDDSINLK